MGLHLGGIGTRIAIFDQHVAAGHPSELPEPLPEILKITLRVRIILGDPQQYRDPPHSNHRHRGLLRSRRERPCRSRAANEHDELAPCHSITSSARPSTASGNERPSSFAVLRLMTSSTFVDWETGSSAAFSPLRNPMTGTFGCCA